MEKGYFIVLEGPDGCGKTTVSERIVRILTEEGYRIQGTHFQITEI